MSMETYFITEKIGQTITKGPSIGELFDAVLYAHDQEKNFLVTFELDDGTTFSFRPLGICHEDESGHDLGIEGYVVHSNLASPPVSDKLCELHYDARSCRGTILYYTRRERSVHNHSTR